jgi:hypothetical protein
MHKQQKQQQPTRLNPCGQNNRNFTFCELVSLKVQKFGVWCLEFRAIRNFLMNSKLQTPNSKLTVSKPDTPCIINERLRILRITRVL